MAGWRVGAALVLASLAGTAGAVAGQGEAGLAIGSRAPVMAINDLDGRPVDLGQWLGKRPVLIEFWATWCPNCEELLPRLREAHGRVGDRVEFVAINVAVNQTRERVRRYLGDHAMPFHILYDEDGRSPRAYEAPATSYIVIVDAGGRVAYTGLGSEQQFEQALMRVAGTQE